MKKLYMLCLLFSLSCVALQAQNGKYLGTWESTDSSDSVQMILDDKGFMTFRTDDQLLGGIGYNVDGQILRMRYKISKVNGKTKLAIVIRDMKTKEIVKRDTGTITYMDANNIQICFNKTINESNGKSQDCRTFLKLR